MVFFFLNSCQLWHLK